MEFQSNFKFLNIQEIARKNIEGLEENEKTFIKLNLLDYKNNPCSFFVFGDKKDKILSLNLTGFEDLLCTIGLTYNKDKWNVSLIDIDIR